MNTIKPSSKMSSAYSTASSSMVMTPSTSTSGMSQASSTKTDGTATPGGSSGLRAQLYHLLPLPRHALFNARIHIKQLYNVPLIKGEFAAKWRIQNVTSHAPGGSLLGKVKQKHKEHKEEWMRRRTSDKGKGKGKENGGAEEAEVPEHEKDGGEQSDSDADDGVKDSKTVASHSSSSRSIAPSSSSQSSQSSPRMNAFDLATQPPSQSPTHSQTRSSTLNTSVSDTNSSEISTSDTAMTTSTTGSTTNASMSTTNDPNAPAPAKGRTAYVPLKEHNVLWDQTLNVGVQIGVQRETLDLLPSELKIVVVQRVIHGDPDAPHNPRLGAVYLNLAEYANTGPVERRYLLRESKTNATLQMTIELTHTGGEKSYHPPPLQKGEVMARVAGLLQREIGLGAGLDGYDYDMALFSSAFGSRLGNGHGRPGWSRTSSGASTSAGGLGFGSGGGGGGGGKGVGAVTIGRSKNRSGGKGSSGFGAMAEAARVMQTTDNIIEAIFNPVPSSSSRQSPFTYYVPPVEREEHTDESKGERGAGNDGGKGGVVVLDRELDGVEDGGDRDGKESESGHTSHSGHAHNPHSRTHSRTASHSSTGQSTSAHSHLTVPGTPGTTSDDQQQHQHARPSENWKWWRKLSHSRPSSPVNGVHPVNASSVLRTPSRSRPSSPMHPPPPPLPSLTLASVPPPLALRTQSSSTTSSSRPSSPLSGVFLQRPSSPKTARPPVPKTPLPPTPDTARPGQHLRLRPPPQRKSVAEDEKREEKGDAGKATYLGVPTA